MATKSDQYDHHRCHRLKNSYLMENPAVRMMKMMKHQRRRRNTVQQLLMGCVKHESSLFSTTEKKKKGWLLLLLLCWLRGLSTMVSETTTMATSIPPVLVLVFPAATHSMAARREWPATGQTETQDTWGIQAQTTPSTWAHLDVDSRFFLLQTTSTHYCWCWNSRCWQHSPSGYIQIRKCQVHSPSKPNEKWVEFAICQAWKKCQSFLDHNGDFTPTAKSSVPDNHPSPLPLAIESFFISVCLHWGLPLESSPPRSSSTNDVFWKTNTPACCYCSCLV